MTGDPPALLRRFSTSTLPWILAACAVVVYAFTLNPWISFGSVQQVARLSGWLWEPDLGSPLHFLVTLPLKGLPETWIPAALNLGNALCAAAILGLLARSVAILPHNRTHEQRIRSGPEGHPLAVGSAWLPPALAVALCGLQLTFWENATAGTREMLDLLLFAYVIRCLLEFRLDGRPHWLWQTAALVGAGMANNYAIVGFLPLYLVALIWLKGLRFFESRFLGRMLFLGLLGASLYLLLPILQSQNAEVPIGFWPSLKYTLGGQKSILLAFPKKTLGLLSFGSLVPILLISIRWPQSFGDLSPQGARFSTLMMHIVHAALLTLCVWIAFDPPVSPRNAGLGVPFLTFYYLGAISIGYFAGYFLLVFGQLPNAEEYTYGRSRRSTLPKVVVPAVWILAIVATAGLALRNLPQIRLTNSSMLRDYATLIADQIPEGHTVVLSDDPAREFVLRSALLERGDRPDAILLGTGSLVWPQYHRMMAERHPDRWPVDPPTNLQARVLDQSLMNLMLIFAQSNQLCYAHPSFGYYFELFQVQPAGILNLLKPYPQGELVPPPLSEAQVTLNERFWNQSALRLIEAVEAGISTGKRSGPASRPNPLIEKLHLQPERNPTARVLAEWLSRSLNSYAVELQRSGHPEKAGRHFEQALRFNPDNVVAKVNRRFNEDLLAGRPSSVQVTKAIEDEFGRYRGWEQVINANGLFDEPRFTMALAEVFLKGRLFRQALREFDRVRQLLPDALAPQLWYARLVSALGNPDEALATVERVRSHPDQFALSSTNQLELVFVEAAAYLGKREPDRAVQTVEAAIEASPANTNVVAAALQLYLQANLYSNALQLIDRQLAGLPDDVNLLVNKGFVLLRMTNQVSAVEVLTRALELQSNNAPARLNRAIANLQLENLDAAQSDYESLLLSFPKGYPLYFGLGEIAFKRGDTNQAIYNFQLYLTNAPPNTAEAQQVRQRLEALRGVTP
ncbi:MAG: tetratricopeptide repeat protein [Verrucomicrobia bacterium]|jgi:tetratricopeptide (TPR) repeat protein|nr:tetratricopeptide repeat protein [Verrucomicrobiota bacterium]